MRHKLRQFKAEYLREVKEQQEYLEMPLTDEEREMIPQIFEEVLENMKEEFRIEVNLTKEELDVLLG